MRPGPAQDLGTAGPAKRAFLRHLPILIAVCVGGVLSFAGFFILRAGDISAGWGFLAVGLLFTGLLATLLLLVMRENVQVERLVEQRTLQLAEAQKGLVRSEKLAALGQIAGSIAHELRNPLGAIRNATYFLNMALERELKGKVSHHLTVINDEIDRSNRIITSLLDFAQGRPAAPDPASVAEIVADALEMAEIPAEVKLTVSIPEDLPQVFVDEGQMVQVLLNVLVNARQALAGAGRIQVAADRVGSMVRVRVIDTGPGIKPEVAGRLFEPLFSTKPFGVGLGLPVCKAFVEANRGTIGIESESGKGTTVTVLLPVAEAR